MFDYLQGKVGRKEAGAVVVDVGGVGYRCIVPLGASPSPAEGSEIRLWVHARISEEEMVLYGFPTREERDLFETIVATVPSLGPRRALSILSSIGSKDLLQAVERGDVARLQRSKGIGEKLASRLVLELRGRLPQFVPGNTAGDASVIGEAAAALQSLGYTRREAEEAVGRALKSTGPGPKLEDLIKRSLENV